jgi:Membrane-associated lipoprotein involved in thiamine biosynthesis
MRKFSLVLLFIPFLLSCKEQTKEYIKVEGFAQGTTYSIVYYDSLNRNFSPSFDSLFAVIDSSMSVYNDSSIISRFNRNEISVVDARLAEVITIADSI